MEDVIVYVDGNGETGATVKGSKPVVEESESGDVVGG